MQNQESSDVLVLKKQLVWLVLILVVCWLPSIFGNQVVTAIDRLYLLAQSPNAYFLPDHRLTLYVISPLVGLSACILFLSPGLFLSLAFSKTKTFPEWILYSFALARRGGGGLDETRVEIGQLAVKPSCHQEAASEKARE